MSLSDRLRGHGTAVVVQFHAPWCGPCRALSPRIDQAAGEFAGDVEVVRIDVDREPDLAREAGVRGVPTLVAFHGGAEVSRHVGSLDPEGIHRFFRTALDPSLRPASTGPAWWHLPAKFVVAAGLLAVAGAVPGLEWLRWPGWAFLAWGMSGLCPSCRVPSAPAR